VLDTIHPWGGRIRAFRSQSVETRVANEPWQMAGYWALRRAIFAREQRLFVDSDRDEHDDHAKPIVALSLTAGMPDAVVGVVRVYPVGQGRWFGGRLGVCPEYRRHGIVGETLIKTAVGTALGAGAARFFATVQPANVRYFQRHHFEVLGERLVSGVMHALMEARLCEFKPLLSPGVLA
jgi:putative N-acetyltransferase (TIGR04045 family)